MKHQLFEEWIFSEEPLNTEQATALQEHLQSCAACRSLAAAWQEVEYELSAVPMIGPEPGFTTRWEARLMAQQARLLRRQSLAVLGFSVAGAVLLLGSLAFLVLPTIESPFILVWAWVSRLLTAFTYIEAVPQILNVVFETTATVTGAIPLIGWVLLAGLISEALVLWLVTVRWLTGSRRIVQ